MVCTRANIAHAVSIVSRYITNIGKTHWQVMKWIFKYLRGSIDVGLVFGKGRNKVTGFYDSNHVGYLDRRLFLTGYIFTLRSSAIHWHTKLQSTASSSMTKTKYMATTKVVKEVLWLKGIVCDLAISKMKMSTTMSLFYTSQHQNVIYISFS